jgi:hypothetical protein
MKKIRLRRFLNRIQKNILIPFVKWIHKQSLKVYRFFKRLITYNPIVENLTEDYVPALLVTTDKVVPQWLLDRAKEKRDRNRFNMKPAIGSSSDSDNYEKSVFVGTTDYKQQMDPEKTYAIMEDVSPYGYEIPEFTKKKKNVSIAEKEN